MAASIERGIHPLSPSFDTVGWLTRDIQTLEFVANAMMPDRDGAREFDGLMVCPGLSACVDTDVRASFDDFLSRIREPINHGLTPIKGSVGVENRIADMMLSRMQQIFQTVRGYEAWQADGWWVSRHWNSLAPEIATRFLADADIDRDTYDAGLRDLAKARTHIRRIVARRVLLIPTSSSVAPLAVEGDAEDIQNARARTLRLTNLAGLGGLPAINLPLRTTAGLPCGACLIVRRIPTSHLSRLPRSSTRSLCRRRCIQFQASHVRPEGCAWEGLSYNRTFADAARTQ
jgi:amidase